MKIDVQKVRRWTILEIEWQLCRVVDTAFMQMQQRAGTYTFKVKNILTGGVQNVPVRSGTVLDQAEVVHQTAVYLYNNWDTYSFMENDTSEIHDIHRSEIEDIIPFLKENLDLFLMMYHGKVLWVILPNVIEYKIKETVPGIKWDRAKAWKKPATLETWLEVQIPLHKEEWDTVTVNTETREAS